jgi:hypothetical protein
VSARPRVPLVVLPFFVAPSRFGFEFPVVAGGEEEAEERMISFSGMRACEWVGPRLRSFVRSFIVFLFLVNNARSLLLMVLLYLESRQMSRVVFTYGRHRAYSYIWTQRLYVGGGVLLRVHPEERNLGKSPTFLFLFLTLS